MHHHPQYCPHQGLAWPAERASESPSIARLSPVDTTPCFRFVIAASASPGGRLLLPFRVRLARGTGTGPREGQIHAPPPTVLPAPGACLARGTGFRIAIDCAPVARGHDAVLSLRYRSERFPGRTAPASLPCSLGPRNGHWPPRGPNSCTTTHSIARTRGLLGPRNGLPNRHRPRESTVQTLRSAVMRRVAGGGKLECVFPWKLAPSIARTGRIARTRGLLGPRNGLPNRHRLRACRPWTRRRAFASLSQRALPREDGSCFPSVFAWPAERALAPEGAKF